MTNYTGNERRQDTEITLIAYKFEELKKCMEGLHIKVDKINGIKTDVNWLKKIMFVIIPSLLGVVVTLAFLVLRMK